MRTLSLNRRLSPAFLLTFLGLLVVQSASARAGGVDYSLVYVCYAVGSIMSIISALIIYIKINNQEGQVMKNIMTLVGAGLYMIGATIVLPAFFGYHI